MKNRKYSVHGICLQSRVQFPEFVPAESAATDIDLLRKPRSDGGMGELPEDAVKLRMRYTIPQGGYEPFTYYDFADHYVARWHKLCDFEVRKDGSRIVCYPWTGSKWKNIRPFLLGRILPLALSLKGALTLHSGAIRVPQGAVALVATSGTGKSTLATSLASAGWPLIADDVLAVRESQGCFFAELGSSEVRLTTESLRFLTPRLGRFGQPQPDYDKSRVYLRGDEPVPDSLPLKAVYLLHRNQAEGEEIRIIQLSPKVALPILMKNISSRILLDLPQIGEHFGALTRMVSQVPVKILSYPSGFDLLPNVCQALLEDCGVLDEPIFCNSIAAGQ